MGLNQKTERKGKLQDALVFSVIEKLTKGAARDLEMGKYLLAKGQLDSAELCFEQAIREAEAKEERKAVVAALIGKSEVLKRRKQFEEAHEVLSSAQELAAKLGPKLLGLVYQQQAEIASTESHWAIALDKLKEAFSLSEEQETASERMMVIFKMGMAAGQLLQFHDALVYYEEAEKLARKLKNGSLILLSLVGQTDALAGLGKAGGVIEKCEQAEEFLRVHRDELKKMDIRAIRIKLLEKRAGSYQTLGHLDQAAQSYKEALESLSDPKEIAKLNSTMALLAFSMGRPEEGRKHEGQALKILEESGGEIPEVLLSLSKLNLLRGRIDTADSQLLQALLELPEKVSKGQKFILQSHEVDLKIQQGRIDEAQELVHILYDELSALSIEPLLPSILITLGNIARLQGNVDEAEELYRKSLEIAEHLQMPPLMVTSLAGLAKVAAARSEISTALEHLDRAIQISEKCGMLLQHQALLVDRAMMLGREGPAEEMIAALEDLLRESRRFESLPLQLAIQVGLALVHWREGDHAEARQYLEDTMEKAAEAGMEFTKILAQGLLGLVLSDLGERRMAEQYLENALAAMEERGFEIEAKHQFAERYRDLTGFWF
jgi:tetratricopeptide (TPR) repeat protein